MQTKLLCPEQDDTALEQAGALLRAGEVVGIPTETVYGLAANALNPQAVARIFQAKGRPQDNPLIVHIADVNDLGSIAAVVPEQAKQLADAFWPGPLTIILPKQDRIPMVTSGGLDTVGIRFPSHPLAQAIIRAAGVPLAAPSANLSGRPSTTTAQHVMEDLNGKIAAVVEGGACSVGVESTVVSLCGEFPRLLRPGGISLEQLRSVLGRVDVDRALTEKIDDTEKVSAPGMKYRHYAPKAPVTVVLGTPEQTTAYICAQMKCLPQEHFGVLAYTDCAEAFRSSAVVEPFGNSDDMAEQAREVFDALRRFDSTPCTRIFAQCPPSVGIGLAVANRIKKAAGFRIIDLSQPMKILGLTGGSGTGKSAACKAFSGCAVIDADAVYKQLLNDNKQLSEDIRNVFGDGVFTNSNLDRKKLGSIVFADADKLKQLNSITHPYIRSAVHAAFFDARAMGYRACILDAPVLFEAGMDDLCDMTCGVIAPRETRIARIMKRDSIPYDYAAARIDAQKPDNFYREHCDAVIVNDGTWEALQEQAQHIRQQLDNL